MEMGRCGGCVGCVNGDTPLRSRMKRNICIVVVDMNEVGPGFLFFFFL